LKIGEAILERDHLDERLDALESRLTDDLAKGSPLTHLLEEIEQTSSRALALQDSIDWTLQHLAVSQKPLGTYLNKSEHLERISALLEKGASSTLREKIDQLREAKKSTDVLIQTIYWAYDLQIPEIQASEEPKEEE
jgi:hypothetical protein